MAMEEIWKDIDCYEGLYQVSNNGNVKSVKRVVMRGGRSCLSVRGRLLKTCTNRKGYKMVHLSKDGKEKTFTVHRLVAKAFIPNPKDLQQINHKDENKENNCASNLEWCDNQYNTNYGTAIQRSLKTRNERHDWKEVCERMIETKITKGDKWRPIPINQFTWDGKFVRRFRSAEQVRREIGITNAYAVAQGRYKHAGGYIWLYDEDVNKIKEKVLNEQPKPIIRRSRNRK